MKPSFYIRYSIVCKTGELICGSIPLKHKGNALHRNGKFGLPEKKKVCAAIGMRRGDLLKSFEFCRIRNK